MAANETPSTHSVHSGDHPLGTGAGAAGGAVAGAAIGAVGGPAGAIVGAMVGAIAGGLAGMGVGERVDHEQEDAYWRDAHAGESYFRPGYSYDDYQPAYRTGYTGRTRLAAGTFDQHEPALRSDWESAKGKSRLTWDEAKHAARASWHRVERALPGDADGDGR